MNAPNSISASQKTKHVAWVDDLKGLGIVLIVAGHCFATLMNMTDGSSQRLMRSFFDFVYLFHVPLFFMLSGLTFSGKQENFIRFFKKKFIRLMVPYYIWGIAGAIIYILCGARVSGAMSAVTTTTAFSDKTLTGDWYIPLMSILHAGGWPDGKGFCFNGVLWFLPVLFAADLIWFWIRKLCTTLLKSIFCFAALIALLLHFYFLMYGGAAVRLPFNLQLLIGYLPYVAFGYVIRMWLGCGELKRTAPDLLVGGTLVGCALLSCLLSVDPESSLWWCKRVLWAIGIASIFILIANKRWFSVFSIFAPFTLGIMLFHKYPLVIAQVIIGRMKLAFLNEPWFVTILSILLTFGLTFICYYASKLVLRFAPWSLGVKCNRQC